MFNFEIVYLVYDTNGEVQGVFKKKANAIESIPETHRNFPKEVARSKWEYGANEHRWKISEMKVCDSNDLSFVKPR